MLTSIAHMRYTSRWCRVGALIIEKPRTELLRRGFFVPRVGEIAMPQALVAFWQIGLDESDISALHSPPESDGIRI